jgi:hypothetical protein
MAQKNVWSLFNKEEKLRIDDLSIEQIRTILLTITPGKIQEWFAWRDGDMSWQNIAEIPEFYEAARVEKSVARNPSINKVDTVGRRRLFEAPPTTEPEEPEEEEEVKLETGLGLQNVKVKERRSARRYTRSLIFYVKLPVGGVFESGTSDISTTGISLMNELPVVLTKSFPAELRLYERTVQLVCSRVNERSVKILEVSNWEIFRQWLVNW